MPEEPNIDEIAARKLNIGTNYVAEVRERFYNQNNSEGAIVRAVIEARLDKEFASKLNTIRRCDKDDLEKTQGFLDAIELAKSLLNKTNP